MTQFCAEKLNALDEIKNLVSEDYYSLTKIGILNECEDNRFINKDYKSKKSNNLKRFFLNIIKKG